MIVIGFSRFLSVPTPLCGPQDLRPEIVASLWMFDDHLMRLGT
jgi:hypothetical protein